MRFVFEKPSEPGTLDIAWTWMPFFVAIDHDLQRSAVSSLNNELVGRELDQEVLAYANRRLIELVCERHPMPGFGRWLADIEHVEFSAER